MIEGLVGVVLAGGKATRMGGADKTLLHLAGQPILAHAIERLRPSVEALAINANGDPARFAPFGFPVIADTIDGFQGPLAGILAGLSWAESLGKPLLVTVAGDTPFFPDGLAARLVAGLEDWPDRIILAATGQTVHPTFGLWPVALRGALADHLASQPDRSVVAFARAHEFVTCDFPVRHFMGDAIEPFLNVNTPEDLDKAEAFHRDFLT